MGQYVDLRFNYEPVKKRKKRKKTISRKSKDIGGISGLIKHTEYPDWVWRKGCTFLVVMNRNGSPEEHTYPLAVYATLHTAVRNAHKEVIQRAGKYAGWIYVNKHSVNDSERRLTLIYTIQSRKEMTESVGVENKKLSIKKMIEKAPKEQRIMFEIAYHANELQHWTNELKKATK